MCASGAWALALGGCEREEPHAPRAGAMDHSMGEAWSVSYVPNDGHVLLISKSGKVYVFNGKMGTQAQPVEVGVGNEGGKMHLDLSQ